FRNRGTIRLARGMAPHACCPRSCVAHAGSRDACSTLRTATASARCSSRNIVTHRQPAAHAVGPIDTDAAMQQHDPMRPEITLGNAEHRRLLILAMAGPGHTADDSDFLHHELDRACVIPDHRLPDDTVRVGSMVTYRPD